MCREEQRRTNAWAYSPTSRDSDNNVSIGLDLEDVYQKSRISTIVQGYVYHQRSEGIVPVMSSAKALGLTRRDAC